MKFILFGEDVLYSFRRIYLIMRFILFISFICPALAFSASSYSQEARISLKLTNVRVSEVLKSIEEQSEFVFFYQDQQVDLNREVSINVEDEYVNQILDQLFKETGNVYKIKDRQIIIGKSRRDLKKLSQTEIDILDHTFLQPSKKQVKGIVRDEKGELVPGANVIAKGTNIGTITDLKGEFSLEVPLETKFLIISFVGYQPQELSIENTSFLNVSLKVDISQLEEVAVTAQAKGQKSAIRQQINSNTLKNVVAPDRLQENPDANATEAIGRLPGISVIRSGGEGSGLVIRGLEPRYSSVSLNGILLPSTSGTNRGTNLSGISQYALQGVEVYKSLTADMDANSVAGTVNLKLREAPDNLHISLMAQGGYNQLNNYYGNYKLMGEISNRFLDNKLGVLFTANSERVNRSIQTMSAAYGIDSGDPEADILLNAISLNDIHSIIYRQSYMLSFDYKVSKGTTLMLYGMYSNSANDYQQQAKSYGLSGAGSVSYSFIANPNDQKKILQTSLSGVSKLNLLNMKTDYGIVVSRGNISNLDGRVWNFIFNNASTSENTTIEKRKLDPSEIVPLFTDDPENYMDCWLNTISLKDIEALDQNIHAYLNITIPFKAGDFLSGNVKFGGMYRNKTRVRDDLSGSMGANANANVAAPQMIADSIDWIVRNSEDNISAIGLSDRKIDNFLNGRFNFGNSFNIDRLHQVSDTWGEISEYYYDQGSAVYLPIFGDANKLGYAQNVPECMLNDQDIKEVYTAGYIMPEINFGKYVMILPGLRFEETNITMKGFYALPPTYVPNIIAPLSGFDTSAVKADQYLLPMIHMRIKPSKLFYIHLAYTETLSRPDFNSISPNYYVNTGWVPFSYIASNPELVAEHWTNLDAQLTFHGNKIGLLSITGFYKSVEDKIWRRSYQRIKGDAVIDPFPDNAVVNVTVWENHPYTAYIKGIELDCQMSFYYLPKPFRYFTLYSNYTYTSSETSYPYTRIDLVSPPGGGRPVATRVDSATTGPMLYQPKNIVNFSLGFNYKDFNAWLSFQYNGLIYTEKNYRGAPRLDSYKNDFYRWDLQITQKFSIAMREGFQFVANIANLSDFTESQRLSGDPRSTYRENYGMTLDLGFRYIF